MRYNELFEADSELVPMDSIQPWESDANKSRLVIDEIKWKLAKGYDHLIYPIVLEPNTGQLQPRSGKILDTGNRPFLIWDGHHRYIAYKESGRTEIPARIRDTKTLGQI